MTIGEPARSCIDFSWIRKYYWHFCSERLVSAGEAPAVICALKHD